MRESMAQLAPRFSANRTVHEYTEQHYLPAAEAYCSRSANRGAMRQQIANWEQILEQTWNTLRFGEVKVKTAWSGA
jgi:glycogen phosphorylase